MAVLHTVGMAINPNHISFVRENTIMSMCQLAAWISLGSVSVSHALLCYRGPLRAVPNLLRELWLTSQEMSPATGIKSSPLKAVACWAVGPDAWPKQGAEIVIVIPQFICRVGGLKGGKQCLCLRQCRLSQMTDEIKCDWRDQTADSKGPR